MAFRSYQGHFRYQLNSDPQASTFPFRFSSPDSRNCKSPGISISRSSNQLTPWLPSIPIHSFISLTLLLPRTVMNSLSFMALLIKIWLASWIIQSTQGSYLICVFIAFHLTAYLLALTMHFYLPLFFPSFMAELIFETLFYSTFPISVLFVFMSWFISMDS